MINDKQGSVASCLRCGGNLTTTLLQIYGQVFTKKCFRIGQHLTKLWAGKLTASSIL